ncbi:MAG: RNB domain-containing ribonuclease [Spirochaetaceae bacterium]|nr:RNB domain-containing ribonuclease [Spirochaetaceae bacterium]
MAETKAALVVYKNKPALVKEKSQDKITLSLPDGDSIKVREKDIEVIHPGPVKNFDGLKDGGAESKPDAVKEAWELLLMEEKPASLKELAELAFGEYSPVSAWAAFRLLLDGLYFSGTVSAISPRPQDQVEADVEKREKKQKTSGEREEFLQRLRSRSPYLSPTEQNNSDAQDELPDDRRFIQDVEALAYGKSPKSKTMKEINMSETPEDAHALLLDCGFWTNRNNPHPARCGISLQQAKHIPDPPQPENRRDLTQMPAFAIDSPWSHDPDDALSLEIDGNKQNLYVHVADPASSITASSPAELEARDRGATLYIPEGSFRMLAKEALPVFALGLAETSPSLTFKITLNDNAEIEETEIFPSVVKVSRLTYEEADGLIFSAPDADNSKAAVLRNLYTLAERNLQRRVAAGAITIDLPEAYIRMDKEQVTIEQIVPYRSKDLVRECMLLAAEGAGLWAMRRKLAVPFIGQEIGEMPGEILPGMAGAYQLRRCMRARSLSITPSKHAGLGLETYTQVTSPLRRYSDLLAHIQIRSMLRGDTPLTADEVLARMSAGEAATIAVAQAERASRNHWTMVYLSDKKGSVWDAIALEKKVNRWVVIIPALALETQVSARKKITPNEQLKLTLKAVNIPKGEAVFIPEES